MTLDHLLLSFCLQSTRLSSTGKYKRKVSFINNLFVTENVKGFIFLKILCCDYTSDWNASLHHDFVFLIKEIDF